MHEQSASWPPSGLEAQAWITSTAGARTQTLSLSRSRRAVCRCHPAVAPAVLPAVSDRAQSRPSQHPPQTCGGEGCLPCTQHMGAEPALGRQGCIPCPCLCAMSSSSHLLPFLRLLSCALGLTVTAEPPCCIKAGLQPLEPACTVPRCEVGSLQAAGALLVVSGVVLAAWPGKAGSAFSTVEPLSLTSAACQKAAARWPSVVTCMMLPGPEPARLLCPDSQAGLLGSAA